MNIDFDQQPARPPLKVWWVLWAATLLSLVVLHLVLPGAEVVETKGRHPMFSLMGMVPLFLSVVLRWLVTPRLTNFTHGFVIFVMGVGFGEACGVLGILLGGAYRQELFILGVLGIAQFVPFYAKALLRPRSGLFYPNN